MQKREYSSFVFKVKACNDAHVQLSQVMANLDTNLYEIVLGGYKNTKSDLRDGRQGAILDQANTPNILHCDKWMIFWIRWNANSVEIGVGPLVGSNTLLSYQSPIPREIKMVSFATGWGTTGLWYLDLTEGK